jgi:uncharacterized protein YigA (DUF484 family)
MATISATSSANTSIQASLAKVRLAQARREADQAESTADDLQAKADNADRYAQKTQSTVRDLAATSRALDATYERQLRASASIKGETSVTSSASSSANASTAKTQGLLAGLYSAANQASAIKGAANEKSTSPFIIVNSQGQSTGRIVNVTA